MGELDGQYQISNGTGMWISPEGPATREISKRCKSSQKGACEGHKKGRDALYGNGT